MKHERQTAPLDSWRGENPAHEPGRPTRDRFPAPGIAGRCPTRDAAVPSDAGDRARCHELRVNDVSKTWRVVYRLDTDAIVILEVFEKRTNQTPLAVIAACRQRLKRYEEAQP